MQQFLIAASYTAEAWAAMLKNPHDRGEAVRGAIEELGGRLEHFWLAFGENDIIVITQMPDNVSAAAIAMAVMATGAVKSFRTTPLLTMAEGMDAMRKAAASTYRPATAKA